MIDSFNQVNPELARLARKFVAETSDFLSQNWDNDALGWPIKPGGIFLPPRTGMTAGAAMGPIVVRAPEQAIGFVVSDGTPEECTGDEPPVLMLVVPAQPVIPDLYLHWVSRDDAGSTESEEEVEVWQVWVPEVPTECGRSEGKGRGAPYRLLAGHRVVAVPPPRARMVV